MTKTITITISDCGEKNNAITKPDGSVVNVSDYALLDFNIDGCILEYMD